MWNGPLVFRLSYADHCNQGQTHKRSSSAGSLTWTHQCWPTNKDLYSSTPCGHLIPSRGPALSDRRKARKIQENPCEQYELLLMVVCSSLLKENCKEIKFSVCGNEIPTIREKGVKSLGRCYSLPLTDRHGWQNLRKQLQDGLRSINKCDLMN